MATFAEKQKRREEPPTAGKKPKGRAPQPPREGPRSQDQDNFTDPESRIMKTSAGFAQSYNAQAAVEVESRLLVSQAVAAVECGHDGQPGPVVYAATGRQPHGRSVEALEKRADPPEPEPGASAAAVMANRLASQAGRERYALRKQTIEPVFGIIKAALGFRRFSLRGLDQVRNEWTLVTQADNLKRLFHLGVRLQAA